MSARISLLIGFLLAGSAQAASTIAPGVDVVPGTFAAGTQPDGNSVIFSGRDGLVVFDTGRHPEHTQKIVDFATAAKKPVVAIVNSHWHLDHVGGNVRLRKQYPDARGYASGAIDDALHGFLASYRTQLEDAIAMAGDDAAKTAPWRAEIALIDAGSSLAPDERIVEGGLRTIAGDRFRVGYESRAVTAGDVWLYDPATRVLVSGDLVTLPAPLFDTACPERWSAALGRVVLTHQKRVLNRPVWRLRPPSPSPITREHFRPRSPRPSARVAQLVEQRIENPRVTGSIPVPGTIPFSDMFMSPNILNGVEIFAVR